MFAPRSEGCVLVDWFLNYFNVIGVECKCLLYMRPGVIVNCVGLGLFADDFYGPKPAVLRVFHQKHILNYVG